MNAHAMTLDAAALGFLISQTSHIETEINKTVYPDIQYPSLIPVDTSAAPWIKSVTYYSSDQFGAAKWINGNADDIPIAGTERSKHETMVYTAGIGYGYGLEEIRHAQMLGINLAADDAAAARRAYEEMVDRVALFGDTSKNFKGLINNSTVTPTAAANGDWGGTGSTVGQIIADFNQGIFAITDATKQTSYPNTVLMPDTKLAFLAQTMIDGTAVPLLDYLKKNNAVTLMTGEEMRFRAIRGLAGAGVGPSDRMVFYRRDPNILKLHIPMPHQFLAPWQSGPIRWDVPGIFRLGGLDIRRPKEVKYIDGI